MLHYAPSFSLLMAANVNAQVDAISLSLSSYRLTTSIKPEPGTEDKTEAAEESRRTDD
jgi:hypothetical protein